MIISLVNVKGGVGKTTLAISIAAEVARTGRDVLVIDADPQQSASYWRTQRDAAQLPMPFTVVGIYRPGMRDDITNLSKRYDYTIVDVGAMAEQVARSCIIAADLVLVPIEPCGLTTEASQVTTRQIATALEYRPEIKAAYIFNKRRVRSRINRFAGLAEWLTVLDTHIYDRVVHSEAISTGRTVRELQPSSPAVNEIRNLVKEITDP